MKRVLLIAYYYPPRDESGSLRPAGLAKYLPQFGWEPIVLTPKLPTGSRPPAQVIETGYRDVVEDLKSKFRLDPGRGLHEQLNLPQSLEPQSQLLHTRAISWLKSVLAYPDAQKGWIPFARQALIELSQREKFDAVLSTSHPVCCHLLGAEAKRMLGCPWIADSRDLWVGPEAPKFGILPLFQRLLEKNTLDAADALVTVSEPLADFLKHRHPSHYIEWITNGFDPEEDDSRAEHHGDLTETFSITYTGTLCGGLRDPSLLLQTVQEMIKDGLLPVRETRIRFYGAEESYLRALIRLHGLEGVVEVFRRVSRCESLKRQRESQIILVLGMANPADEGCYTGKVFEYLASQRPILAIGGGGGVLAELLQETGAGVYAFSKAQLRDYLLEAYSEFRQFGRVAYKGKPTATRKYTHREMARRFSEVLNATSRQGYEFSGANSNVVAESA